MYKVYLENYKWDLKDAIKEDIWEYITDSEDDAWDWIERHEDALTPYEENYYIYVDR